MAICINSTSPAATKLDLAAELLRYGRPVHLRAWGSSMLPTIWPGDPLVIQSCAPAQIALGDIACFRQGSRFVMHRVIEISRTPDRKHAAPTESIGDGKEFFWLTRGDSASYMDEPVREEHLLGKIFFSGRSGRIVEPSRHLSSLARVLGRFLERMGVLQNWVLHVRTLLRRLPVGAGT